MRAIIFANGVLRHPQGAQRLLQPDDLIIAADGGAHHCLALGVQPALLVGDFDSLAPQELARLQAAGTEVVRYPVRKDATDLELAVEEARGRGATEVLILGGVGSRWDQSLANLLLAAAEGLAEVPIRLVDGLQEARLLRGGQSLQLRGRPGDTVSLIPLAGEARGITTQGLEYPLEGGSLPLGSTRGVSNTLLGERGMVHLEEGLLMCIQVHGPLEDLG